MDSVGQLIAPVAFSHAVLRRLFDFRPAKPTLSYRAIPVLNRLLEKDFRCAEFGSGMSTRWFAERCQFLLSVENDAAWHAKVSAMIAGDRYAHVRYELRKPDDFSDLSDFDDGYFDFALVDGWDRFGCVKSLIPKIKPGGWIYLDNTDKDMTRPDGDLRRAEKALLEAVTARNGTTRYFTDFSTGNFFAEQGLLARL